MATDDEPLLHDRNPAVQEHIKDYSRFTAMLKWGAIAAFLIGIIVVFIISE